MTTDAVLELFEQTAALRKGHFELRSGLHSDQFFQCALVLQHPAHATALCEALLALMPEVQADVVMAPALGGITLGYEMARQLGVRAIFAEKQEGRLVLRRGYTIEAGERVVIAEDVITRGGRVQEVIDIVESQNGAIQAIAVLVDRSGGQASFRYPLTSLIQMEVTTWPPDACPLCAAGVPLEHPGS